MLYVFLKQILHDVHTAEVAIMAALSKQLGDPLIRLINQIGYYYQTLLIALPLLNVGKALHKLDASHRIIDWLPFTVTQYDVKRGATISERCWRNVCTKTVFP
jgi:hypothetical protein